MSIFANAIFDRFLFCLTFSCAAISPHFFPGVALPPLVWLALVFEPYLEPATTLHVTDFVLSDVAFVVHSDETVVILFLKILKNEVNHKKILTPYFLRGRLILTIPFLGPRYFSTIFHTFAKYFC